MNRQANETITFRNDDVATKPMTGIVTEVLADNLYMVTVPQMGTYLVTEDDII